jgi:hypothetical protein
MKTNTKNIARKIFFLFSFFYFLNTNAQAPDKMSYQAVIRNASNALVANQIIGMRITILTNGGLIEAYKETQSTTTNANGLASIKIGEGTVVAGNFSTIDWGNTQNNASSLVFIKTETDPTGGTNYTIFSQTQLLSVPYALNSKTTSAVKGTSFFVPKFSSNNTLDNSNIVSVGTGGIGFTGINRTNPITQLDVNGQILTRNRMVFGPTPTGDPEYDPIWAIDNSNNNFRIFNQPNYYDPGSTYFSIAPTGNVSMTNNLNVAGSVTAGNNSQLGTNTTIQSNAVIYPGATIHPTNVLTVGSTGKSMKSIQFGNFTVGQNTGSNKAVVTVDFDTPMPNTNYVVTANAITGNGTNEDWFTITIQNKTIYGFTVQVVRVLTEATWSQNLQANYIAICGN